eukprot:CAMPEP_0117552284 /NCGR_PEP_ID=MMETSP0784-20121206/49626_1 /TAXON_ID=39447 /ORGANISM="" /LENGTH=410 /DNA_ID=CAMNT_0005349347 /DNA_START=55 /DNA_END=1284 /DNA_ORIENTATION=+
MTRTAGLQELDYDGDGQTDVIFRDALLFNAVSPGMKYLLVGSWLVFTLYVFCLPLFSMFFNDVVDLWQYCQTPAEHIECAFNRSFYDIALSYNGTWASRWRDGKFYGCGCGEGVFPDWMCSVVTDTVSEVWGRTYDWFPSTGLQNGAVGFTVSYYIGTAPGTGLMAGVSAFPIAAMWWYGAGNEALVRSQFGVRKKSRVFNFTWKSLIVFQLCYIIFLMASGCLFGITHLVAVGLFLGASVVHFLGVAILSAKEKGTYYTEEMYIVLFFIVFSSVAMLLGFISYAFPSLDGYGYMYAEAVGLSCVFAVTPALVLWQDFRAMGTRDVLDDEELDLEDDDVVWTEAGVNWVNEACINFATPPRYCERVTIEQLRSIASVQLGGKSLFVVKQGMLMLGHLSPLKGSSDEEEDW